MYIIVIFIIAVESLSIRVRNSQSIAGLNFGNDAKSIKISQYRDDFMIFQYRRIVKCNRYSECMCVYISVFE